MASGSFFNQLGRQFMQAVLRSPLHGMLSGGVVLITVTGRKSGKKYTTPVNYLRQGDVLRIVSLRNRTWWRNLRGGSRATLRLKGKDVEGWGIVVEDNEGVAAGLAEHLEQAPRYAKYFGVSLDGNGQPNGEDVAEAAKTRVVVKVELGASQ